VRCDARVSIVFLGKNYLISSQPAFDFFFCGVPQYQHSLIVAQRSSCFTHSFLIHSISSTHSSLVPLNMKMEPFGGLFEMFFLTACVVDPGFISFMVPTNPKTIGPFGKPGGKRVHKMHCVVSPEIDLNGWLQESSVYSLGLSMRYGICIMNHLLELVLKTTVILFYIWTSMASFRYIPTTINQAI
jgi:hypothetical protein